MLTLYSTSACHLCELAETLLHERGAAFAVVDISDSDELFQRYGMSIPVLQRGDGRELNWPFDADQLQAFLESA